jgi:WD40 repeat protein
MPKLADKDLYGSSSITVLSFSRTDSNMLASGELNGAIKVWNVHEQTCIHSFDNGNRVKIRSLFFAGGAEIACLAVTHAMSVIRLGRAKGSSEFASETIGEADQDGDVPLAAVFFPSGCFVAISFGSITTAGNESTLALYELETMTKTQSVVMPGFTAAGVAVTLDSKQLVVIGRRGGIRLLQTDDLSIQRDLDPRGEVMSSVAFDPTCRVLAFGREDGRLELRSL